MTSIFIKGLRVIRLGGGLYSEQITVKINI